MKLSPPLIFPDKINARSCGLRFMGRTVPSYRMLLEYELKKLEPIMKALPSNAEKRAFQDLMNAARLHADAGSMAVRPIPMETVFMCMMLAHEKALKKIQDELKNLQLTFHKPS